jgi:histidine phosphotransferase ChpT
MQNFSATLAALVGSRLCHDLISPIGAIQNGLELIALSGADQSSPEMTLIQDSCASAAARIRFFRVAYGAAGEAQMMSRREIAGILSGVTSGGRLTAEWSAAEDQPRPEVQLCFLAFQCCESALPMGGAVRIENDAAGWTVRASGARINGDRTYWDHINGAAPLDTPPPDKVHFALLPILAAVRGRQLLATLTDDSITLKIA